ncbi:mitofusin [Geranomyces michiganensis]|nr:mitofusin [Geranomyces michiganensis]
MSSQKNVARSFNAGLVSQPSEKDTAAASSKDPQFLKADSAKSLSSTTFGLDSGYGDDQQQHAQALFAQRRGRLCSLIGSTKTVLGDLMGPPAGVSGRNHCLRYPMQPRRGNAFPGRAPSIVAAKTGGPKLHPRAGSPLTPAIPAGAEGATAFADDSGSETGGEHTAARRRQLRVLQLDLNSYPSIQANAASVSKSSSSSANSSDQTLVSQLLEAKLLECTAHLDRLQARISDTRSKVLVTGDLNAGKSTFVNAVLRREIVPDDQQPCTALFAEVVDAEQNQGLEEVHGINNPLAYDRTDPTTFTRFDFKHLRQVVEDNDEEYQLLKVYCKDKRGRSESLLHNGVVDISLIDSPGLNIDSIKTTALFSQQEEIDVIVFVVNAENHFTLSAREFLTTAGKEKAYIFIVVNRFDQIRRKDRCRRDILEQIRQISPATYDNADTLVHFVSAKQSLNHVEGADMEGTMVPEFHKLEGALRSFILEKRSRSKLAPAQIYLQNLLADVVSVAQHNADQAGITAQHLAQEMEASSPIYSRMLEIKTTVLDDIDQTIDATAEAVRAHAQKQLAHFVDNVDEYAEDVEWHGPLYVWQYAKDLRNRLYQVASMRVRRCEDFAREKATACLKEIERVAETCMSVPPAIDVDVVAGAFDADGATALATADEASATSTATAAQGAVVPVAVSSGPTPPAVQVAEFFENVEAAELAKEYAPSLALIGVGAVGYQRMAANMIRTGFGAGSGGNRTGRLAFAGLTLAGVGIFLYVLSDMRRSVERQVTHKMREHFSETMYVTANVDRVARTTASALRLSVWDFRTQFHRLLAENERRQQGLKDDLRAAEKVGRHHARIVERARTLSAEVASVDLEALT